MSLNIANTTGNRLKRSLDFLRSKLNQISETDEISILQNNNNLGQLVLPVIIAFMVFPFFRA